MSSCRCDGSRPDVEEAKTTSGPPAPAHRATQSRVRSSRSGALSWTKSAPSTASPTLRTNSNRPSRGSGIRVSRPHALRALSSISRTLRADSGSGSYSRTSTPCSTKRAAHPLPMTPPPSSPTALGRPRLGSDTLLQAQPGSDLVRSEDLHIHVLKDAHRALDQPTVGSKLSSRQVQVVLQTDPDVAAREHRHGHVCELHATDGERREDRPWRQLRDHAQERERVIRRPVRDAHAELDERRLVDEALLDQLLDHDQVPGVEHLKLWANTQRLDLRRHGADHRWRVGHHVVAAGGEVHRAAVDRADLRQQLLDMSQPFRCAGHVSAFARGWQRVFVAAEHEVSSHAGRKVQNNVYVR